MNFKHKIKMVQTGRLFFLFIWLIGTTFLWNGLTHFGVGAFWKVLITIVDVLIYIALDLELINVIDDMVKDMKNEQNH